MEVPLLGPFSWEFRPWKTPAPLHSLSRTILLLLLVTVFPAATLISWSRTWDPVSSGLRGGTAPARNPFSPAPSLCPFLLRHSHQHTNISKQQILIPCLPQLLLNFCAQQHLLKELQVLIDSNSSLPFSEPTLHSTKITHQGHQWAPRC